MWLTGRGQRPLAVLLVAGLVASCEQVPIALEPEVETAPESTNDLARPVARPSNARATAMRAEAEPPVVTAGDGGNVQVESQNTVDLLTTSAAMAAADRYVLWQNTGTGRLLFWPLLGTTYLGSAVDLATVPTQWQVAGVGNFTGDASADVLWQHLPTGRRLVWPMSNNTVYPGGAADIGTVPPEWEIAAVADFNIDNRPDLVWQNRTTGRRGIYLMNGVTVTSWIDLGLVPVAWQIAGAGDMNCDGRTDIVWQNMTTGTRGAWPMINTTYGGGWISFGDVPTMWEIAGVSDFNYDGRGDLLWQNRTTGLRGIWPMGCSVYSGGWHELGQVGLDWEIAAVLVNATPAAPTAFAAEVLSSSSVQFSWADESTNEYFFHLELRVVGGSSFTEFARLGANATTYRAIGLTGETDYEFRMRACGLLCSGYTFSLYRTTLLHTPSNLSATAVSGTQINLTWTDHSNRESRYNVERRDYPNGTWTNIANLGTNATSYSATGLQPAKAYEFRVRACGMNCSSYSPAVVKFTPYPTLAWNANYTVSGAAGSETWYSVIVPTTYTLGFVTLAGGTGDADIEIYGRGGTPFMCRSDNPNNEESCNIHFPSGEYLVRLTGNTAYSGATLRAFWMNDGAGIEISGFYSGTGWTTATRAAIDAAIQRWERVLLIDVPGFWVKTSYTIDADFVAPYPTYFLNTYIDDLFLHMQVENIDGPGKTLGWARPVVDRVDMMSNTTYPALPLIGQIVFDAADISRVSAADLTSLALHEIGHVLGINSGTTSKWSSFVSNRQYTGPLGFSRYRAAWGWEPYVPTDSTAHWSESRLKNELMTPYTDPTMPLSAITLGALVDAGWPAVDFSQADGFIVTFLSPPPSKQRLDLSNDVRPKSRRLITDAEFRAAYDRWLRTEQFLVPRR